MNRRNFLKLPVFLSIPLFAKNKEIENKKTIIEMVGPLDDDLIIIKNTKDNNEILECLQMHNFTGKFSYDNKLWNSIQSPGYINFNKTYEISEDDIYLLTTINEREDLFSTKTLNQRTHYKSAPLYVNNIELFPSVLPEQNDVKDYPLWYAPDEDGAEYNYYQLWENAVVNCGLLFPNENERELLLIDNQNEIVSKTIIKPTSNSQKAIFKNLRGKDIDFLSHPFTEVNNSIFEDNKTMNDLEIRKNAVYKIAIIDITTNELNTIPLPYPFPYINRLFFKSVGVAR